MYVKNITDDYDNMTITRCTDNENNIDINVALIFLAIP